MNLCTNADHAMRDTGGILAVSLTVVTIDSNPEARILDLTPGDFLCLQISDTGYGMPENIKANPDDSGA